jgi:hypothetical protein
MEPAAPMVIMMMTPGAFLAGRDTENNDAGCFGIDAERPVEHFVFDSGEQIEHNSLTA